MKWECELDKELKNNPEMLEFFEAHDLVEPMSARSALFGGRTNALRLYHKCLEGEFIFYRDVCR